MPKAGSRESGNTRLQRKVVSGEQESRKQVCVTSENARLSKKVVSGEQESRKQVHVTSENTRLQKKVVSFPRTG